MRFFVLPYDSGHENVRMGAGPLRLAETLGVDAQRIDPPGTWRAEIGTTFALYRELAKRVAETDDLPVVFSGNCGAAVGVAAGVGMNDLATLWFDAHGDYNTPDTTDTGYLDGMAMAILTGRCWKSLALTIPGFTPMPPQRAMHVGARDYSPGEREALLADDVALIEPDALGNVAFELNDIDAQRILIHLDVDVLDPKHGRANQYACDGGLSPDEVLHTIELARSRFPAAGLVVASYDPSCDPEGRVAAIVKRVVDSFC